MLLQGRLSISTDYMLICDVTAAYSRVCVLSYLSLQKNKGLVSITTVSQLDSVDLSVVGSESWFYCLHKDC